MRRKKSAAEDVPVFNKFFSSSFSSTTVSSRYAKALHKKKLLKFHAIYGATSRRTTENSGVPDEDILRSEEVQLEQVKSRVVRQEVEDESAVNLPQPEVMPSVTLLGSISSVVSGLLKFAVVMLTPRKRLIARMNQEEVAHYTKKTIHQPTLRKIEHAKRLEEEEKQRGAAQERVKKYNQQKVTLRQKTQVLNKELAEQAKQVPKTAAVVLSRPPEPAVEVQPAVHFEPVAETASSTDSMHSILDEFDRELERIRSIPSSFSTAHYEVARPEPVAFNEPTAQTSPKTASVHSLAPFAPRKYKFLQSESNEEFGITTTSGNPRARSSSPLIETFDDLIMQLEVDVQRAKNSIDDHARNAALDINDKFKNSSNVKEFPKY
jgi:hypothetical protein